VSMHDETCVFCGRPATKLCDFPMGFSGVIFDLPKGEKIFDCDGNDITAGRMVPCSRPMCDECATEWEGMDFCPSCVEKAMREIILKREAEKSEQRNFLRKRYKK